MKKDLAIETILVGLAVVLNIAANISKGIAYGIPVWSTVCTVVAILLVCTSCFLTGELYERNSDEVVIDITKEMREALNEEAAEEDIND